MRKLYAKNEINMFTFLSVFALQDSFFHPIDIEAAQTTRSTDSKMNKINRSEKNISNNAKYDPNIHKNYSIVFWIMKINK